MKRIATIKRWIRMLSGNSVFHMRQAAGKYFDRSSVAGYYSDLRHKVTGDILLDDQGVPVNQTNEQKTIYFPITIFQYGLGAYDLFLETQDPIYLDKFMRAARWAVQHQGQEGGWDAFGWCCQTSVPSSMAQGEGTSLLCRAHLVNENGEFLEKAKKAVAFMLRPVEEGGTARYFADGTMTLEERPDRTTILNGFVFSIWGLYDYWMVSGDASCKESLDCAVDSLVGMLGRFDCGYWTLYDLAGNLASPFYHDLHIEQLEAMDYLFEKEPLKRYIVRWKHYQSSFFSAKRALVVKAFQKLGTLSTEASLIK